VPCLAATRFMMACSFMATRAPGSGDQRTDLDVRLAAAGAAAATALHAVPANETAERKIPTLVTVT
jgi:hypothetical protein